MGNPPNLIRIKDRIINLANVTIIDVHAKSYQWDTTTERGETFDAVRVSFNSVESNASGTLATVAFEDFTYESGEAERLLTALEAIGYYAA